MARKYWTRYVFKTTIIECRKMNATELFNAKQTYGELLYKEKIPSLG